MLAQKDGQLKLLKTSVEETVQTTVESGIQSYSAAVQQNSAAVKQNSAIGTVCNSNILKKVMKSVAAEEDRSKNLIVSGRNLTSKQLGLAGRGSTAFRRVKITVASSIAVHQIVMKTGRLRLVESHKDVWILDMFRQIQLRKSNKEASGH